jgi:hypothetical protein
MTRVASLFGVGYRRYGEYLTLGYLNPAAYLKTYN